jgi:hypothetical protein
MVEDQWLKIKYLPIGSTMPPMAPRVGISTVRW